MKKSFLAAIKDFIRKFFKSYKEVSRISGGCAYIPPNCLSSQKTEQKAARRIKPKISTLIF